MPLKGFTVTKKFGDSKKRILFKDCVFSWNETFKDEDIKYPAQIFIEFTNYLQNKYHSGVFGEYWRKNSLREDRSEEETYKRETKSFEGGSSIDLTFYVPSDVTKEQVLQDIKSFESRYPNQLRIGIDMKKSTKEQYNKIGGMTYSNLLSFHKKNKSRYPNTETQLERAIEEFKKKYNRDPDTNNKEDREEIAKLSDFLSLVRGSGDAFNIAKRLFKLNWGTEPNLDDEDDREELLMLYNMNQEGYRGYYTVAVVMEFAIPIFSPKYEDRKIINLRNYYIHDSKQNEGDNKMKKDADPRLELVEKIKMKEHPDYKNNKYDLNDDFVVYSDYQFNSYPKEGLLKLDWVATDLSEDGYTSEEAMKWDNQKIVNYLQNIIDNDPYSASIQGLVDLNTIDGLKRILKRAWDWNGEDNSVNDSKQEQICDSFSKRYNK